MDWLEVGKVKISAKEKLLKSNKNIALCAWIVAIAALIGFVLAYRLGSGGITQYVSPTLSLMGLIIGFKAKFGEVIKLDTEIKLLQIACRSIDEDSIATIKQY